MSHPNDFDKRINFSPTEWDKEVLSHMATLYPHLTPPDLLRQALFDWNLAHQPKSGKSKDERIDKLLEICSEIAEDRRLDDVVNMLNQLVGKEMIYDQQS